MKKNLLGERFGLLTVTEERPSRMSGNRLVTMWHCKCDCGNELDVIANSLTGGRTKSCGCAKAKMISQRVAKHRGIDDRLYKVWANMKARCHNPNHTSFSDYGGRGIKVCSEWDDYSAFRDWALANGYNANANYGECTIDRINNDGDYTPDNCRWVDMSVQRTNTRTPSNARLIEYNGKTKRLCEWATITGLKPSTLGERLRRGWNVSDALTEPLVPKTARGRR